MSHLTPHPFQVHSFDYVIEMNSQFTTLLLGVLVLVTATHGKSVVRPLDSYSVGEKVDEVFTYLGSSEGLGIQSQDQGKSLYFLGEATIPWEIAQSMCINVLGNDADLINIETREEHDYISRFLPPPGSLKPSSFWTAGKYTENLGNFTWSGGEPVDGSYPWGVGQPTEKTKSSRINMVRGDNGKWTYNSSNEETHSAFICEFIEGSASEPVPCFITNDLLFVLDSSGSIDPPDYVLAKENFTNILAVQMNQWEPTLLAFMIFSTDVKVQFNFTKQGDFELERKIKAAPHLADLTYSHLALQKSLVMFNLTERFVQRNVVFLTDGLSQYPVATAAAATKLHEAGINVYSVGIGQGIRESELLAIAGGDRRRVFTAETFAALKNLLKPMSLIICEEGDDDDLNGTV